MSEEYKIPESVKNKIRKFVSDREVFECFDNLFKAIKTEEQTAIEAILDDSVLPEAKTLKKMAYHKGRLDMLKRVCYYLYNWKAGIKALQEKCKKELEKKKQQGG